MPAEVSLVREPYASNSLAKSSRHLISPSHPLTLYWFSVKMTARLDVNATPGGRMSPYVAPGIVLRRARGASRVKRAARAGFAP